MTLRNFIKSIPFVAMTPSVLEKCRPWYADIELDMETYQRVIIPHRTCFLMTPLSSLESPWWHPGDNSWWIKPSTHTLLHYQNTVGWSRATVQVKEEDFALLGWLNPNLVA